MGRNCSLTVSLFSGDSGEFEAQLDSNDEEFSRFEPGSKDFIGSLRDIPEGSAESIALSLLGKIFRFNNFVFIFANIIFL